MVIYFKVPDHLNTSTLITKNLNMDRIFPVLLNYLNDRFRYGLDSNIHYFVLLFQEANQVLSTAENKNNGLALLVCFTFLRFSAATYADT